MRHINTGRNRCIGKNGNDSDEVYKAVVDVMKEEPFIGLKSLCKIVGHNPSTLSRFYIKVRRSEDWLRWTQTGLRG